MQFLTNVYRGGDFGNRIASKKATRPNENVDVRTICFLALALLSLTAPLELSQLVFAVVGALAYAVARAMQVPAVGSIKPKKDFGQWCAPMASSHSCKRSRGQVPQGHRTDRERRDGAPQEVRQISCHPIQKPTFKAADWDGEVQELLRVLWPTQRSAEILEQMSKEVKRLLRKHVPEFEVTVFLTSDLRRGTAFGVAVPEVDIVASVKPDVFLSRVRGLGSIVVEADSDEKKMQKCAIRFCINHLVGNGSFKFRRSAFKGLEPKVTLLASASFCGSEEAIPVDFTVNSSVPLHNAVLIAESGKIEPRARGLILLVRRWAKDRGICHAAKGHLMPYAWTVMVIYFLQVGVESGALLPPLEGFPRSYELATGKPVPMCGASWKPAGEGERKKTIGGLFKEFITFFSGAFNFQNEAVSIRRGHRGPPGLALPIHIVGNHDLNTEVAPCVEDPFDLKRNLSECMTALGVSRFHEEIARAKDVCSRHGSLAELLDPWVPTEVGGEKQGGEGRAWTT